MTHEYNAFMCYAPADNQGTGKGPLFTFRDRLSVEVRLHLGIPFDIYGLDSIDWGEHREDWKTYRQRWIEDTISRVTFFIPILTPSFFRDGECRTALSLFLHHEAQVGRGDLILPVYYITIPELELVPDQRTDELIRAIAARQWVDWRDFRFEALDASPVRQRLAAAAADIRDRVATLIQTRPGVDVPIPSEVAGAEPDERDTIARVAVQSAGIPIEAYLRRQGFQDNPFTEAHEAAYLSTCFIQFDWFKQLVRAPRQPQSQIVFAPPGHGKTAHRLELARRVGERQDYPVLIVMFDMLGQLVQATHDHVSLVTYLDAIHRKILIALKSSPEWLARCHDYYNTSACHEALQHLFAVVLRDPQAPGLPALTALGLHREVSLVEWPKELARLAHAAGFSGIAVFVDGVDTSAFMDLPTPAAFTLISPLLDVSKLLHEHGFSFLFFLPDDLREYRRQPADNWLDDIPHYAPGWTNALLIKLLARRLVSYSQPTQSSPTRQTGIASFQQLCDIDIDFDVDARLVQAAQQSPRQLLNLAQQIVERHCQATSDLDALISAETIRAVLSAPARPGEDG